MRLGLGIGLTLVGSLYNGIASPLAISGCKLWLDPRDNGNLTNVSGKCSSITDKSGTTDAFAQATAGLRPLIGTGINGHQTLDFVNASNTQLNTTTATPATIITAGAGTTFVVFKNTGSRVTQVNSWTNTALLQGISAFWGIFCSTTVALTYIFDGADKSTRPAYTSGAAVQYTSRWDGTNLKSIVGTGVPGTSVACGNLTTLTGTLNLGGTGAPALDGSIGEVIVYNRTLTDQEVAQVQAYLTHNWGV